MKPRLHCPVSRPSEIEPLLAAGADAFYAGLVPQMGSESLFSFVNRRHMREDNFSSLADFEAATTCAHAARKPFYLTVNELVYDGEMRAFLWKTMDAAAALPGLTGVIVADIALAGELRARYARLEIIASSLAGVTNRGAVRLWQDRGVGRIVLPRSLCLDDVAALTAVAPEVEFECFMLNDRCPNTEHLCGFVHAYAGQPGPAMASACKTIRLAGVCAAGRDTTVHRERLERRFPLGLAYNSVACGACASGFLVEAGVRDFKIVGRDRPIAEKVAAVRFLRAVLDVRRPAPQRDGEPVQEIVALRKRHLGLVCAASDCYYAPASRRRRSAATPRSRGGVHP